LSDNGAARPAWLGRLRWLVIVAVAKNSACLRRHKRSVMGRQREAKDLTRVSSFPLEPAQNWAFKFYES
jgi:hypothetical protein